MLSCQFSNIIIYVKMVGKIPDKHLNVWLFSNPRDKVQKIWKTTGQICPVLSTRIWTLSPGLENNHTHKCWSDIFPTILTYMNNISVQVCSPIQGTTFYSGWNLMKPGSQSGTYRGNIWGFSPAPYWWVNILQKTYEVRPISCVFTHFKKV